MGLSVIQGGSRKLATASALALFLAACSSGVQTATPTPEEPALSTQATTVSHRVPDSASDAEEANGLVWTDSPVLELGEQTPGTTLHTGVRFLGVNVPRGADVTGAYIEFSAVTTRSEATSLTAYGNDVKSAGPFGAGTGAISARIKTTATVTWQPGAWSDGTLQRTTDLTSIVEEITNRSDWAAGNAMAFMISGKGLRKAQSFDASSTLAPRLVVSYNPPVPPVSNRFKPDLSMTVKPDFSLAALQAYDRANGTDAAVWHQRLVSSANFKESVSSAYAWTGTGGPLRVMGREAGQDISTLLLAFRMTGDRAILDRVEDIMRYSLSRLVRDGAGRRYWASVNNLEEGLAYGAVAQAAYAFYLNRNLSADYANMYNDLRVYLRNDFERRYQSGGYNGGRVTDDELFHPYVSMTRYYWYMHLMTKNSAYADEVADAPLYKAEADRKGDVILRMLKTDSANGTYVWSHRVWPETWGDCSKISVGYKCAYQMSQYPQETAGGFSGLLMDGFEKFANNAFAQKLARSYSLNLFNGSSFTGGWNDQVMSSDVGRDSPTPCSSTCSPVTLGFSERDPHVSGNPAITLQYVSGSGTKSEVRHTLERNMALLGIWDASGSIPSKVETYYNGVGSKATALFNGPVVLLANELYRKGAYSLD